jgi:hypothetical protein
MGNRGSKSVVVHRNFTEKEQRVDGKLINSSKSSLGLRCTLNSFERNLLVIKAYPNIKFSRSYTSVLTTTYLKLDPFFVTGFVDAEGCFTVTFQKNLKVKNGYSISPRFKISLHKKDLIVLEQLKVFFGVGSIQSTGKNRDSFEFVVKSLKDLTTVILPHFDKYPLITQKRADYELFKMVIASIIKKEHLSTDGLLDIINIKASMNNGLSKKLTAEFPISKPCPRPMVGNPMIPHPQWIAGFTSGDGSFSVLIRQITTRDYTGEQEEKFRIILRFTISQHKRDRHLMINIINYLNCGHLDEYESMADFRVERNEDNLNKIIPFFNNNNILGMKAKDFKDWEKIANIISYKGYLLNKNDVEEIYKIKNGMNKGRIE